MRYCGSTDFELVQCNFQCVLFLSAPKSSIFDLIFHSVLFVLKSSSPDEKTLKPKHKKKEVFFWLGAMNLCLCLSLSLSWARSTMCEARGYCSCEAPVVLTRPNTWLSQSRAGGQGLYIRSLDHLGRSSEAKDRKKTNKVKWDGRTDQPTDGSTNRLTDQGTNKAGCRVA